MPGQPLRRSPRLAARASKAHAPKCTLGILRGPKAASRGASKSPARVKFGRNAVAEFEEDNSPDKLEPLSDEVVELLFPHNVVSKSAMGDGQTKRNEETVGNRDELFEYRDCSDGASRDGSKSPTRVTFGRNAVAEFEEDNSPDELEPLSDKVAEQLFPHNAVSKSAMGDGQMKRNEETVEKWDELFEDRDCSDGASRGRSKSPTRVKFGRNAVAEFEEESFPDELELLGNEEAEQLFPHNVVSKSAMDKGQTKRNNVVSKSAFDDRQTKRNEETLKKWDGLFEDWDYSDDSSVDSDDSTGGPEPSGLQYVVAQEKEIDYLAITSPGANVCQPRGETNKMPTATVDVYFCDFCKRGVRRTTEYFYE